MTYARPIALFRLVLLFSSAVIFVASSLASENALRFVINSPGSAPYIYFNVEHSRYEGVVVDFFESVEGIKVNYLDSSRARNEKLVQLERADLFLGSSIWIEEPERFIYSDPIMHHNSFMYATQKFESTFLPDAHYQAKICTRFSFAYPVLDPFFKDNRLIRLDSSSQITMTNMLANGRCDFAVMSEDNARALMSLPKFCNNEFFQSPEPISKVNVSFVMGLKLTKARTEINQQLAEFIHSGNRDKSIQKHVGTNVFPKRLCNQNTKL